MLIDNNSVPTHIHQSPPLEFHPFADIYSEAIHNPSNWLNSTSSKVLRSVDMYGYGQQKESLRMERSSPSIPTVSTKRILSGQIVVEM